MFLKFFKPTIVSFRNKKKVLSFLSSLKTHINYKKSLLKLKLATHHKFLNNSNSTYVTNVENEIHGSYIIFKWLKVNYANTFFSYCFYGNGSIVVKPAAYGFSFDKIYHSYFISPFINRNRLLPEGKKYRDVMGYNFVLFFEINSMFFYLHDYFTKKYFAKSGGTFCRILNFNKTSKLFLVKLPSKKKMLFDYFVLGFFGRASNIFSRYVFLSSFKQKLVLKKHTPKVRGIAQNPIDHPNGGSSKVKQPLRTP